MKRILVTGATGQIGHEVVSQLRATRCRIRAMSRNPRPTGLPADVEVVRGDLSEPGTLGPVPGPFALNCRNWWTPQLSRGDVVRWFDADAVTAPVHEQDIAAVAVHALCDEGHDGREHVLTGPASLTQREQLSIIGDVLGRSLRFEEVSPESAREQMLAMRFPPSPADMLRNAYAAAIGQPALVTSTVCEVTGAPARSFQQWAVDHAGDFQTPS